MAVLKLSCFAVISVANCKIVLSMESGTYSRDLNIPNLKRIETDEDGFTVISSGDRKSFTEDDFIFDNFEDNNNEMKSAFYINDTGYHEDPFQVMAGKESENSNSFRFVFTAFFLLLIVCWVVFLVLSAK